MVFPKQYSKALAPNVSLSEKSYPGTLLVNTLPMEVYFKNVIMSSLNIFYF